MKIILGTIVELSDILDDDGVMSPVCRASDDPTVYRYDQPNRFCISKHPLVR